MNPIWTAIQREAALAAEHLAIGVSALGKVNYARPAYYSQMFFALTIGIERASKLALAVHHATMNNGRFPSEGSIRGYRHGLGSLLDDVDRLGINWGVDAEHCRLPRGKIHTSIIDILSAFAANITRYYNLDVLLKGKSTASSQDPIAEWYEKVTVPVFIEHVSDRKKATIEHNASIIHAMMSGITLVRMTSETGDKIDSVGDASCRTGIQNAAVPHVRMYLLQICRFLGAVLSHLGYEAQSKGLETIPYLSEFFAVFNNEDRYFRSRKIWSIYP